MGIPLLIKRGVAKEKLGCSFFPVIKAPIPPIAHTSTITTHLYGSGKFLAAPIFHRSRHLYGSIGHTSTNSKMEVTDYQLLHWGHDIADVDDYNDNDKEYVRLLGFLGRSLFPDFVDLYTSAHVAADEVEPGSLGEPVVTVARAKTMTSDVLFARHHHIRRDVKTAVGDRFGFPVQELPCENGSLEANRNQRPGIPEHRFAKLDFQQKSAARLLGIYLAHIHEFCNDVDRFIDDQSSDGQVPLVNIGLVADFMEQQLEMLEAIHEQFRCEAMC